MKILVITLNAWDDTRSTGNTISNIFANADGVEFANLYCRNEKINNNLCHNYFQITEGQIITRLIGKSVGRTFELLETRQGESKGYNPLSNNALGDLLRRYRPSSLLFFREAVWKLPFWKNDNLKKWLLEFKPDIIYMHGHANIYMHCVMEYCTNITNAKVVLFLGDDMYGRKKCAPIGYIYETLYRKRLRRSISLASLLFGGSIKLCAEYKNIFGKEFTPMFKQCDLSGLKHKNVTNSPLTIVYAGNLLFGREKAMCDLVEVIKKVNESLDTEKIQLITYSNTPPQNDNLHILNDGVNSVFMGCKSYSEVCMALDSADMSLFLESFEKSNIKKTRLSFSTKIIDCMRSNSALLAIGPASIASMEYIRKNGIGLTAVSMKEAYDMLNTVCNKPEIILASMTAKNEFAKKHHSHTSSIYINMIKDLI